MNRTPRHDPAADRIIDHSQYPVLFVDDEAENLRVFELAFRREFRVATASGPQEALEYLAENPVAVVLSDQRMPNMTGVEFLTRVREFDPSTVRMLVTAFGDFEVLSEAINQGSISRFIPKPWIPEEMRMTIRSSIEAHAREKHRRALLAELDILHRAGTALCSELDLDALLDRLLEFIVDELRFDGATVLLRDRSERHLVVARSAPRDNEVHERLAQTSIDIERAETFRKVLDEDAIEKLNLSELFEMDASVREFAAEVAAEEMLLLPLRGPKSIGILAVDNRRGGRVFRHDDETLLMGLAAQAAIAVENARLVQDLHRAQEQTRRADRLGTLGTMAAGLAHEISNPLVSIQTFLKLAPGRRQQDDAEFWGEYHTLACRETERIRTLVQTMSRLSADDVAEERGNPRPCVMSEVIDEALQLLAASAQLGEVEIGVDLAPDLPKVNAEPGHLHQVVTNLLLNAVDASPPGAKIAVRGYAETNADGLPHLTIEVRDWGGGMSAEVLERVFDPFYTTKAPDQGSGLGLMVAHRIIGNLGGTIEAESSEGQGSTFRVLLPVE